MITRLMERQDEQFKQILGTVQTIANNIAVPLMTVWGARMQQDYMKQQNEVPLDGRH